MSSQAQLLIYGFEPGAEFEGRMVGAIERIESGGTLRVLDVVFVMRDRETAELVAIEQHGRGQGSLVAPLLGFRLDPGERRRLSEKALRADADSGVLRRLGDALEPGAAVAAVLRIGVSCVPWAAGSGRAPPSPRCWSSTCGCERWMTPSRRRAGSRWRA